jgi:RHS repeat-associated protein
LLETDAAGGTPMEFIFFGGKRIARRDSGGAVSYFFADHLGTSRVVTNATGTPPFEESDYYPFGGERAVTDTLPDQNHKLTGKERDMESGLDYFGARYYSSTSGRFLSPDPENAGASEDDPQSWNAYAYARNNPLLYTDPDGLKYRLCNAEGHCTDDYSDADFEKNFVNDKSIEFKGNEIYKDGQLIGTFERLSFDDLDSSANSVLADLSSRAPAMEEFIYKHQETSAAVAGGRYVVGRIIRIIADLIRGGHSTGRTEPTNLKEKLAMEQARSNPAAGTEIPLKKGMTDPRWPASKGWVKMRQNVNGVEVHYLRNRRTGEVADWKFKD